MNNIQKIIKMAAICLAIFIIVNIIGGILWAISLFTNIDLGNNNSYKNFSNSYTNITSIELDISSANISIEPGNEFRVDATEVRKSFSAKVKKGTLIISEKKNGFWNKKVAGNITIYVPSNIKLNELEIDNGAGFININSVSANKLEISQGAGSLDISNSDFDNTDIDGGAGEIKVAFSTLNNLDMDSGVGKIEIEALIMGNSKIDCGVGEIDITLLGNESNYKILTNKGIGSIKINGENQKNDTVYGNGSNTLELDGGVGSITVEFKDFLSQ